MSGPAPPGPDPGRALAVRGSFRGVTGHDHHTREFVRHLAARGVRLQLTDIPQWHPVKLPGHARDPWFERLDAPVGAAAVLQFCMPHQVTPSPGRLTVNYTMFEASPVRPAGRAARTWSSCPPSPPAGPGSPPATRRTSSPPARWASIPAASGRTASRPR